MGFLQLPIISEVKHTRKHSNPDIEHPRVAFFPGTKKKWKIKKTVFPTCVREVYVSVEI